MVIYHYAFNLSYFLNYPINLNSFPINIVPPLFSACFIFVSGYSSTLSKNSAKRGFYVLFWGMIITIVTFIFTPEAPIYFGILHCLGSMMIIKGFFLEKTPNHYLLIISIVVFLLGFITNNYYSDHNYFLFLGLTSRSFTSLDYYPLIPHGAFFILGLFFARKEKPTFLIKKPKNKIGEVITLAGKNSLKVYLLHQPIFFIIYYLIKMI